MSDVFDKSFRMTNPRSFTRESFRESGHIGASVGGESYAPCGARAGKIVGGKAQPSSQPVDSAGCLFFTSGHHYHSGVERVGWLRCDANRRS